MKVDKCSIIGKLGHINKVKEWGYVLPLVSHGGKVMMRKIVDANKMIFDNVSEGFRSKPESGFEHNPNPSLRIILRLSSDIRFGSRSQ